MKGMIQSILAATKENGFSTYAGAVALVVLGLAGIVLGIVEPESPHGLSVEYGLTIIVLGLQQLGVVHKSAKIENKLTSVNQKMDDEKEERRVFYQQANKKD